jgi:hypothetical protein
VVEVEVLKTWPCRPWRSVVVIVVTVPVSVMPTKLASASGDPTANWQICSTVNPPKVVGQLLIPGPALQVNGPAVMGLVVVETHVSTP